MVLEVGLVGCGTIGAEIAKAIDEGSIPEAKLVAVLDNDPSDSESLIESLDSDPTVVESVDEMLSMVSIVVEAASHAAAEKISLDVLESGTDLLTMSVGAFAEPSLRRRVFAATESGDEDIGRLHVPSGAIAGLDAIKAAALTDELETVTLTTSKPPAGLTNAPYVKENNLDLFALDERSVIFEGPATEAAHAFPSNINVAIALSLAGIGPDDTMVTIVADPEEENNVHRIESIGSAGRIETTVRNVPSPKNPETSYLAALSAIEKIRSIDAAISVGT